jgi:hypothetical protein
MPAIQARQYVTKRQKSEQRKVNYAKLKEGEAINRKGHIELLDGSVIERVVKGVYLDIGMVKSVLYNKKKIRIQYVGHDEHGKHFFSEILP